MTKEEKLQKRKSDFISKAESIHNGKYDYLNVNYIDSQTKVAIICPIHGEFWQTPANHLRGCQCPQCANDNKSLLAKDTKESFIAKAKDRHGDKYKYDKVNYIDSKTMVTITCPKHGDFSQLPSSHIRGVGCPYCGGTKLLTQEEFLRRAKSIHGDEYDYSKAVYKDSKTPVTIICRKHGEFTQTPEKHLMGQGCKVCGLIKRSAHHMSDTDTFITKAINIHGDKYDYSKVIYKGDKTVVDIICSKHGIFSQTPHAHLQGQGCPECGKLSRIEKRRDTAEEFINKAKSVHGDKYLYDKVKDEDMGDKVVITCPIHGDFPQDPHNHLMGAGCPICGHSLSKAENEILEFVKEICPDAESRDRTILEGKELDIYIPSKKMAIEYNGLYWHSDLQQKDIYYHLQKTEECIKKDIRLIHIFEDEWVYHKDIVLSRLSVFMEKENRRRVYARDCEIKLVDGKGSRNFLEENHLQGTCPMSVGYGLFYKDELLSIMTFGTPRQRRKDDSVNRWEMLRFCNKGDVSVVGGASKLLSHFIKEHNPEIITTYADRRWSDGNLYTKLGFIHIRNTQPNYFYVIDGHREGRFKYRKSELIKQGYDGEKSEREIMRERGIARIYDCGNMVFELKNPSFNNS